MTDLNQRFHLIEEGEEETGTFAVETIDDDGNLDVVLATMVEPISNDVREVFAA